MPKLNLYLPLVSWVGGIQVISLFSSRYLGPHWRHWMIFAHLWVGFGHPGMKNPMSQRMLAVFFVFFLRVFGVQSLKIGVFLVGAELETANYCIFSSGRFKMYIVLHLLQKVGGFQRIHPIFCDFDSLPSLPHFAVPAWSMGKQQGAGTTHAGAACEEPCWIGSSKRRRVWRMMPTWISQAIKFWETSAQGEHKHAGKKHRKKRWDKG